MDRNNPQKANNKAKMRPVVNLHTLTDFHGLNTRAQYWDWDLRQIESGPFEGSLFQFGTEEFHVTHITHNRVLEHRGKAPDDVWNFIFLSSESTPYCVRKHKLDQYGMLVLQPGEEIKGISHPGLGMFAISVQREKLELKSNLYAMPFFNSLTKENPVLNVLPTYTRNLESKITRLMELGTEPSRELLEEQEIWKIEDEFVSNLMLSISPSQQQRRSTSNSCRILEKAMDYIQDRLSTKITIQDLCTKLGVSERTLQYAFKEHYGISPINYMRAIRLSKVYQTLIHSNENVVISDIARAWGFSHMSQFTADYKKHFCELPSETLAR